MLRLIASEFFTHGTANYTTRKGKGTQISCMSIHTKGNADNISDYITQFSGDAPPGSSRT